MEKGVPGTGLGLTIVQAIVEGHRGRLEMRSAEGEGASFTVVLPVLQGVTVSPAGGRATPGRLPATQFKQSGRQSNDLDRGRQRAGVCRLPIQKVLGPCVPERPPHTPPCGPGGCCKNSLGLLGADHAKLCYCFMKPRRTRVLFGTRLGRPLVTPSHVKAESLIAVMLFLCLPQSTVTLQAQPVVPRFVSSPQDPRTAPAICHNGVVIVVEQPRTQLLSACLVVGSSLVVDLRRTSSQGPRWLGPPLAASSPVLVPTFSGSVNGLLTSHFIARKAGTMQVVSQSNATCTFQLPSSLPCSAPVFVTTLVVRVLRFSFLLA